MKPIFRTILPLFLLAALFGAGCSDDAPLAVDPTQPTPAPGTLSEVTIGCRSGIGAEVRTSLGGRDETTVEVRWTTDDTFRLSVREAESGQWITENARFALQFFSSEWSGATFAGLVDLSKYETAKSYDYFASAPAGASTLAADGTATFTLPALQNGEFSGAYDWMTASLKGARALEGNPHTDDPLKPYPQLTFTHRIHVLEITLADILLTDKSGATEPIEAIELTFPTAVAGQLSIAADAEASALPVIAEGGGRTIRLEFATPRTKDEKVYAFIAPVQLPADAAVAIKAFGTQGHESVERTFLKSDAAVPGLFRSGRVSPITYRVPQRRIVTKVEFSLGDALGKNTLGEEVTKFRIVEVDGSGNPTSDPIHPIHTFDVNAENKYVVEYEGVFNNPYSGKQYKVQYCSPSTKDWVLITKAPFTIDAVAEEYNRIAALPVPYLFEEDFSKASGLNSNGTGSSKDENGTKLEDNYFLSPGWTGNQIAGYDGYIEIKTRRESTSKSYFGFYHGRLDSAPVSALKTNKTVVVSFSYYHHGDSNASLTRSMRYGITTDPNPIQAYSRVKVWPTDNEQGNHVTGKEQTLTLNTGGTITNWEVACTPETRLSWEMNLTNNPGGGNDNHYLRISDVKVSIKQ